jgi:SpoVK/Ycf46/Vps4 family AAA+-type ATPase
MEEDKMKKQELISIEERISKIEQMLSEWLAEGTIKPIRKYPRIYTYQGRDIQELTRAELMWAIRELNQKVNSLMGLDRL